MKTDINYERVIVNSVYNTTRNITTPVCIYQNPSTDAIYEKLYAWSWGIRGLLTPDDICFYIWDASSLTHHQAKDILNTSNEIFELSVKLNNEDPVLCLWRGFNPREIDSRWIKMIFPDKVRVY